MRGGYAWLAAAIAGLMFSACASADPMTFRWASSGGADGESWIAAEGEIVLGTPEAFLQFLAEGTFGNGRVEVYLNSPGGDLDAGLALGRLIRGHGFGTYVAHTGPDNDDTSITDFGPGQCLSACSYAFLGGKWRRADDRTVGVHQFYYPIAAENPDQTLFSGRDLSSDQKTEARLVNYIVGMGVDARFLAAASQTEPDTVHLLTTAEMAEYDVTYDDLAYMGWAFEPYKDGLIAFSKSLGGEKTATLFCRKNENRLRLFLSQPIATNVTAGRDEFLAFVTNVPDARLFGFQIPDSDVSGRIKDGALILEFKLPPSIDAETEAASFGLSGGADASVRPLFKQALPFENFNTYARLILRNCY